LGKAKLTGEAGGAAQKGWVAKAQPKRSAIVAAHDRLQAAPEVSPKKVGVCDTATKIKGTHRGRAEKEIGDDQAWAFDELDH